MHHSYLAHTNSERKAMLDTIQAGDIDTLFSRIPDTLKDFKLKIPAALSELELSQELTKLSRKNTPLSEQIAFLGAGSYHHFLPAALDNILQRPEFLTSYTPYQAEISQGTLQVIYEFQSALCSLTGMDIANASAYEGASATAEAMLMAKRITRRNQILVSAALHPEYKEVLKTYAHATDLKLSFEPTLNEETDLSQFEGLDKPAALIIQYPNFIGHPEDLQKYADWIHEQKGLLIVVVTDPVSLGLLEAPGHLGADIVVGEAQAFGNAISFGGPYLGFITARSKHIRQMPGRLSGRTQDGDKKEAFALVLQTREQHIRREKATSNICTNQGLNALAASIWLALIGKEGLSEISNICIQRAHYFANQLKEIPGFNVYNSKAFFHEFILEYSGDLTVLQKTLREKGISLGVPLKQWYPERAQQCLINVTEMISMNDIQKTLDIIRQLSQRI